MKVNNFHVDYNKALYINLFRSFLPFNAGDEQMNIYQAYDLSNQMYFVQSLCFINKVGAPSIKVSIEINHEGL